MQPASTERALANCHSALIGSGRFWGEVVLKEQGGHQLSYFNAGCPAPGHAKRASFPLAYAEFSFAGRAPMGATVPKTCAVKE